MVKSTWTDADFGQMGWHDCPCYGFLIVPDDHAEFLDFSVLIDLDYFVRWVVDTSGDGRITFWVSPATLAFAGCDNVRFERRPLAVRGHDDSMCIVSIHRSEVEGPTVDRRTNGGSKATGSTSTSPPSAQYLRRAPRHEVEPLEDRAASFACVAFDDADHGRNL